MTPAAPDISVCIPARDAGVLLAGAVASALAQEDVELEVLVHDDGSTDGSVKALPQAGEPRVLVSRSERPVGVAAARSRIVRAARGRHVAFLDADDELLPGALARAKKALDAHPGAVLAHGWFEVIDARGRRLADWEPPFPEATVLSARDATQELVAGNFVTTSTATARRDALLRAGPFSTRVGTSSSDWDMWLRLAEQGDVLYLGRRVARYRQHPDTISAAARPGGERLRCDARVVRRALHRNRSLPPGARRRARAALAAKALIQAGDDATRDDRRGALRAMLTAASTSPGVLARPDGLGVVADLALGREYGVYRRSKRLLARCARDLAGTRAARRLSRLADSDPTYEASLARAAGAIRKVVPPAGYVATIDKWDPTLLALSRRRGRHFPDRRLLPDYPADSAAAVAHLEALRDDGVDHLAVPAWSGWWLEHYGGLREHLEQRYSRLLSDPDCSVWSLRS